MKNRFIFFLFGIVFCIACLALCGSEEEQFLEPEANVSEVFFGDPFILLHNGVYYAYGTASSDGIEVYTSNDLLTWKAPERKLALHKNDVYANRWFWAPEVYHVNGKFYMYYSGDEHICVATADSPLGPFRQEKQQPMIDSEKCIDNSLFIDDDGKAYLFFDRFNDGLNIWVAELEDDLINLKTETMRKCINVSQAWEEVWPRVNEGAFVVKHNGVYYMTYSANSYESPFYGIGVATATNVFGPWTKYDKNPIYQNVGELVGIGHSAMFTDKEGKLRIVFHSHNSKTKIHPRIMHISTVNFKQENGKEIMTVDPNYFTPVIDQDNTGQKKYRNPVIQANVPDPTIIQLEDGGFYVYGTAQNVSIYHSTDLVNWTPKANAFTNETRPSLVPNAGIWAPNINYINGKYVMYYSQSIWGGETTASVGVAIADHPEGPFTDKGLLVNMDNTGVQNCIDPDFIEDNGGKYLFWGSWHGIWGIELTDDGLKLKEGSEKRQIAGTAYEAASLHKRNNYYYLFASVGSCCNGLESTYTTVVGRSENLWGPYTDKQGRPMMQNNHEAVISKNGHFVGVGHNSGLVQDKAGNDWILYHGFSVVNQSGRRLFLDKIVWVDNWPTVAGGTPSIEADAPVF